LGRGLTYLRRAFPAFGWLSMDLAGVNIVAGPRTRAPCVSDERLLALAPFPRPASPGPRWGRRPGESRWSSRHSELVALQTRRTPSDADTQTQSPRAPEVYASCSEGSARSSVLARVRHLWSWESPGRQHRRREDAGIEREVDCAPNAHHRREGHTP